MADKISFKQFFLLLTISCFSTQFNGFAQRKAPKDKGIVVNGKKISYDDSLMNETNSPYLLPYNRIIDGAGTVTTFGSSELENHSLDAVLTADKKTLVVEDRFGIAFFNVAEKKLIYRLSQTSGKGGKGGSMNVYSGIKAFYVDGAEHIFWTSADVSSNKSFVYEADWDGKKSKIVNSYSFDGKAPASSALANEVYLRNEGGETFLYVVLNGNSQLAKLKLKDKGIVWQTNTGIAPYGLTVVQDKVYVTNWGGSVPNATAKNVAGVPYAAVNINPVTGATSEGTVSVIDTKTGHIITEITTGLHPNAIIKSHDEQYVYVANGNSDNLTVIDTKHDKVVTNISVRLNGVKDDLIGDSPDALAISEDDKTLYVANGGDNAVAVINLDNVIQKKIGFISPKGFIPTQAYPGGLVVDGNTLFVTNLEGVGARISKNKAFNSHKQEATVSFITLPNEIELAAYTAKVKVLNMQFRSELSKLLPRKDIKPVPLPERIGEPSTIKHIIYIIKENRTYDQVLGDLKEGWGDSTLCSFGEKVTPNEHLLAKQYGLLDNYHASGKSSAEGHQWTDAAMVTDYVEKNVRAWFRSYPHVQQDALVYDVAGFIWNQALDHGKSVRIFGEACEPEFDQKLTWTDIYQLYTNKKPFEFKNNTTISRVEPILSQSYPGYDSHKINDQIRADAFLKEWKDIEDMSGDQLPQLMIIALPADHTAGTKPGFPTPSAMVADNDLALGRIVEVISHSRFWDSTAIFVTEDDSQDGWDHISAYRTPGFVISPYSPNNKVIHTNYNQTSVLRTIEQILGIPPMNKFDATASPMFSCFTNIPHKNSFQHLANRTSLDEMNKPLGMTKGKENYYARMSMQPQFDHIDGGNDDLLNKIIWYSTMGKKAYPVRNTLRLKDND